MDKKYESLTIQNAFVLSKVMLNGRISKKLMEKLTENKIYKVSLDTNPWVKSVEGNEGIAVKLYMADLEQNIQDVELYVSDRDLFNRREAVYRFAEQCREVPDLRLQGSLQRIFVCATADTIGTVKDEDLKAFLCYVMNSEDKRSNLVKMLDDEVRRVKRNSVYAKEYRSRQQKKMEICQLEYARLQQGKKGNRK